MYYSEYLTLIKNEIQLDLLGKPVTFICIAIERLSKKTPIAYQKKLKGKIKELITKEGMAPRVLIMNKVKVPEGVTYPNLVKRIMLLESMITSARKREAAKCQKTLL